MMRKPYKNSLKLERTDSAPGSPDLGIGVKSAATPGFTLVEIMIALAVVAIGLIAIVGMIPQGIQSARDAADNTLAATIVQDTLNQVRLVASTPGGGWPPSWPSAWYPDAYYDAVGTNQISSTSPDRYYRVNLNARPSALVPNLLTVVAIVSWPAQSASPLNAVTNFTQIANYQN
jgi:uncharacterized protein (TIGR02598 family)